MQPSLFRDPTPVPTALGNSRPTHGSLDAASEAELDDFRVARLAEGAHPRSAAAETSQLRMVVRASAALRGPSSLVEVFSDLRWVARALRQPPWPMSRSTGRARLRAAQRFLAMRSAQQHVQASATLAALDALLPARPARGWHTAGTAVAGHTGRRRRRGPTLSAVDLERFVEAAGAPGGKRGVRDRALVTLHCFSGLRPGEIVELCWKDREGIRHPSERRGCTALVTRGGHMVRIPLSAPAVEALQRLAVLTGGAHTDVVFRVGGPRPHALTYRAAREIVRSACLRAGFPSAEAGDGPGCPAESSVRVRILLLFRPSLQTRLQGVQGRRGRLCPAYATRACCRRA